MLFIDQIFKDSPNPTYIKDSQGKIVWANTAYALLHRSSLPQLLENGAVEFDFSYERDLEILASDEVASIEEFYKLDDRNGTWFLSIKKAIVQPNGERFLLSSSSEITDLKETIQIAEDSFATKEKFIHDVNRELEAPVNAIISLVRLLKKTFINKDQKRYLNSVLSISDHILDIPKDVLEYDRVEAGVLELTTEVVSIVHFIREIITVLNLKAAEHDVSIHFSEPLTRIPDVEVNPVYLNLILSKMIRCAIRYTKSKEIGVSVFQEEKGDNLVYLQFSIHNLELGQSAEFLAKFFESDFVPNSEERYKMGGLDLGIYTSKRLIDLQGGSVWLKEESERGMSIEFILPFSINDRKTAPPREEASEPDLSDALKLLLVEDNESSQTLVKHQIQNWNTKIDIAGNGEEGIRLATEKAYDLILMDVEMPGLDGFKATSLIRDSNGPNRETPIIAFTTNAAGHEVEKFREAGFTDYLRKPYHAFDLYLCISKNTGHYEKERLLAEKRGTEQEMPLYDFSGLGNMAEDEVFIRKMQKLFIDIVPGQLLKLSQAIQQQEWETVALLSHSLKSTFGNIKVTRAANAMKEIEAVVNKGTDYSALPSLLEIVKSTTDKVVNIFVKELSQNQ
ncbi:response regulator [Rufibacter glacialis]|uniref:histidine kinase n=1 Tax=Rufibacter glacialis TaxID=1259555 RepID=A0A5M8QNL9_9BACT|nr:response regulator [Rufibacter glacialis]KAA6437735.1 response regulator [Rufibacter glacialis]GGK56759.1 hypothetical protein GCM10011405_01100 [Rufibacter glacialis]